ncbi:hypothetical protein VE01_01184 [Pseudogymnoascus verrucosus]|uniref:J domain-containing protein n=1 Tax=Pseudogymnoascus verrucosus TaxID=342668 RepID=A0A1B8GXL9_9PEZI|nr:uncharacterized protein VE01_01184 [Pseudogymnoascus verrucosus]OBU00569.1 hypothetical protein VE01_01184 [Pseudogymnoascus verrucosus]
MSSQLLSLAGWAFLPNLATNALQSVWYGITIRAGDPKPQPSTPLHNTHRRRIHIAVITTYLLYTIYEAHHTIRQSSDYYQDLGLPHSASDREIKSRFRRLAALYHPDKVAETATSTDFFRHLKTAQDTLLNPAARFAYDRFGPDIVGWANKSSIRDYLTVGAVGIMQYYGIGAVMMYVLGLTGHLQFGVYWRWFGLLSLAVLEAHIASRPYAPRFASHLLNPLLTNVGGQPPYLPFQLIAILRKCALTLFIALSQLGPLLSSPQAAAKSGTEEERLTRQVERIAALAGAADAEASRLVAMEMAPFVGDEGAVREVQRRTSEWLVSNTIRSDPEVRDALGNVLKRRRVDAPAGARGNR